MIYQYMKAILARYEKFIVRRRYIIEITVYQVTTSTRYHDGLKWGLICVDRVTGKRVLLDNHHPKGAHLHLDGNELPFKYLGLERLINDFRRIVSEHMGVKL